MNLKALSNKLEKCASGNMHGHAKEKDKARNQFIGEAYCLGGKNFVERVKLYGRTEKGISLNLSSWYCEYLEAIGDFRIHHTLTSGPAQCGKTLGHVLLMIDCLTTGKLNGGWFYDTRTSLDQNVPIQFTPTANYWISAMEAQGNKFWRGGDRSINTRFQVDGATAVFAYVSTSRISSGRAGIAAAGSSVVSFQADFAILEERSQYAPGSADPIPRRLDASLLPTKPMRELGTPGGGQGIEKELETVEFYFYPHYKCPNCGAVEALDPLGCLLRETERTDAHGKKIHSCFSESGRPSQWFHHDEQDPIKTAYIGCKQCTQPLDLDTRLKIHFRCKKSGTSLRQYLDGLPKSVPQHHQKIGIHLSPLCRNNNTTAEELIRAGLTSISTADWQQQGLGIASQTEIVCVSPLLLRQAMSAPKPQREHDLRVAGIDVGRSEDWLVVLELYLPDGYESMPSIQVFEETIRVIKFAGDVMRPDIGELLDKHYVDFGLIDNEPSRESSMNVSRETCLELGNQISGLKNPVRQVIVSDGGIDFPCWDLRVEKFMQSVFDGFYLKAPDQHPLYRLPSDWDTWFANPTERSPIRHLSAPWRSKDGKWHRPNDKIDDLYMAFFFAEAAFYIYLNQSNAPTTKVGRYYA